ncbi:KTSC domain-containing protein [Bacillus canaveralius]|uniref:KTSC domain-containing protein n=1 Tax=Bacillus canaveralius TaxID=1403243 RepID=A0A2N5GQS0_9BACI|nr:KTSC domain-containing protein [Bacillus canaveralius]PLR94760.1 KTSC domain-containing protein [Bacillus canaveralius]
MKSVGYEVETQIVEVEFPDGNIYQYYPVPENIYKEFITADSLGTFLNKHIKTHYECRRINK